jgi:hypothetical protein
VAEVELVRRKAKGRKRRKDEGRRRGEYRQVCSTARAPLAFSCCRFPGGRDGGVVARDHDGADLSSQGGPLHRARLGRQRLDDQGLEGVGSAPQEFAKTIEDESALNKKLTVAMGIVPQ